MKLAFLILAHKNPKQLQKLTDYLLSEGCRVFIHIDKKSSMGFSDFITSNKSKKDLEIYAEYPVYWGSFNQIEATFFLLKKALLHSDVDYLSLISGQDLPVKPMSELKEFLSKTNKEYFTFSKLPNAGFEDKGGLDRYRLYWVTDFNENQKWFYAKWNVFLHALQNAFRFYRSVNVQLYGGANWFTISRRAAEYADDFITKNNSFYLRFRNTRCADEIILQTILMSSPLASSVENNSLREVDWKTGPEYPRTFRMEDYNRLTNSSGFFARKFDENIDNAIIDKIYSYISPK
ncbi:MAG: hypothetical protein K0S32_2980 [Bacteroidetes bacterium]|jgi:hypothetical protein|nr:hypothetical protein [Bacteroidota bacterium]